MVGITVSKICELFLSIFNYPLIVYFSELMASMFHHLFGMNCTCLRFFTVYSPRGRQDMAPFKFIDRISNGLSIQQYGDGSTSRDYTYIDDIANGVVLAIDKPLGCEVNKPQHCTCKWPSNSVLFYVFLGNESWKRKTLSTEGFYPIGWKISGNNCPIRGMFIFKLVCICIS